MRIGKILVVIAVFVLWPLVAVPSAFSIPDNPGTVAPTTYILFALFVLGAVIALILLGTDPKNEEESDSE